MQKDIHPKSRLVLIKDSSSDYELLTYSSANVKETIKHSDGNEYPLIRIEVSSASHPFYTGKKTLIDTEGRVDKFKAKLEKAKNMQDVKSKKVAKKQAKIAEMADIRNVAKKAA